MATVGQKRRTRSVPTAALEPVTTTKRRLPWRLALVLLVPIALVLIAPSLLVRSPLRDRALNWCLRDVKGSISIGDASLGWFTPLVASDVLLQDEAGNSLIRIAEISGDKGLLALAMQPHDLGQYQVQQPQISVVLHEDLSNFERVFATWLAPAAKQAEKTAETAASEVAKDGIAIGLEIVDGSATVTDTVANKEWKLEQIAGTLHSPRIGTDPLQAAIVGNIVQAGGPSAFSLKLASQQMPAADNSLVSAGQLELKADEVPLCMGQSFLRRSAPGSQLDGAMRADVNCQWGLDRSGQIRKLLTGQVTVSQLLLAGPLLSGDQLQLGSLDVPCEIAWEGDAVQVQRLSVKSDFGQIACQGEIPSANRLAAATSSKEALDLLSRARVQATGQLDLAKLAQALPRTIGVRPDTQITSGLVNLQLASQPQGADTVWQGRIETSRLEAQSQGQPIAWDQPLLVTIQAHGNAQGLSIDQLQAKSDFLQLEGKGTEDAFRLGGSLDLDKLAEQLAKFIHMQDMRLAGQGTTSLTWNRNADSSFQTDGELKLQSFELTRAGQPPWTEAQLALNLTAAGSMASDKAPLQINTAQVNLVSGGDQLSAVLKQPVKDPAGAGSWPIDVRLQGQMASWLARVSPWFSLPVGSELTGATGVAASVNYSPTTVVIESAQIQVQPLHLHGAGLFIDEPTATITASGQYSFAERRLEIRDAQLQTSALAGRLAAAMLQLPTNGPLQATGDITFDGDLGRLGAWTNDPAVPANWQLAGRLHGQGALRQEGTKTTVQWTVAADDVAANPRQGQPLSEPSVKLAAAASYDGTQDVLDIQKLEIDSDMLDFQLVGTIGQMSTERQLQLSGQTSYDLEKVQQLLQPYVGTKIQLSGREQRAFTLAGPLSPAGTSSNGAPAAADLSQLTGKTAFGWNAANLYGFRFGQTDLQGELAGGIFRIVPTDLAVGSGKIHLAPQVRLAPGPADLTVPPGVLADHIEITEEMCNAGLMYIAPPLANVAQAQGQFSITMDNAHVPLGNMAAADFAGQLTVHSVQISPGPLVQELSVVTNGVAPAQLTRESVVQFRMVQGRIYHQGLELVFPDVTIRTRGSVGIDHSVALLAEMPVPSKWIGNNPLGDSLKNQVIQVPIGGTLEKPQIDRQALDKIAAQFVRSAADSAIRGEVNKGLNSLFKSLPLPGGQ
jgi:translocation and assembly module TamB